MGITIENLPKKTKKITTSPPSFPQAKEYIDRIGDNDYGKPIFMGKLDNLIKEIPGTFFGLGGTPIDPSERDVYLGPEGYFYLGKYFSFPQLLQKCRLKYNGDDKVKMTQGQYDAAQPTQPTQPIQPGVGPPPPTTNPLNALNPNKMVEFYIFELFVNFGDSKGSGKTNKNIKKVIAKKPSTKKVVPKKPSTKKVVPKKPSTKKVVPKKPSTKKVVPKKSSTKKSESNFKKKVQKGGNDTVHRVAQKLKEILGPIVPGNVFVISKIEKGMNQWWNSLWLKPYGNWKDYLPEIRDSEPGMYDDRVVEILKKHYYKGYNKSWFGSGKKLKTNKPSTKKVAPKKPSTKKVVPKKPSIKKVVPKKPSTKKVVPKKPSTKKVVPKKPSTKKVVPKKPSTKKVVPKKPSTKKVVPKKPSTKKVVPKKPVKKVLNTKAKTK